MEKRILHICANFEINKRDRFLDGSPRNQI